MRKPKELAGLLLLLLLGLAPRLAFVTTFATLPYSDFRTVEGLSLPFKTTATFDGQPFPALSATVEAITINGQIDPASFKKPQPKQ